MGSRCASSSWRWAAVSRSPSSCRPEGRDLRCAAVTATIRDARPEDLADILQMVRDLAAFERMADQVVFDPDEFGRHVFGPDPVVTVNIAEVDGEVAGMALWFRSFSTFLGQPGIWLEDLYVQPQHRGHGVGGALLRHLRSLTDGRVEW